jgi:hypothetical protein
MDELRHTNEGKASMPIEDLGPAVRSVWNGLRMTTRKLVERAWQSINSPHAPSPAAYDPKADSELIRLLETLDAQPPQNTDSAAALGSRRLAEVCSKVLMQQTQSAEVFARLIERAHERNDYRSVDAIAEKIGERLAPSEICELARSNNVIVRALAQETLTVMPTSLLIGLLRDPVDAPVAHAALERQAAEYGSAEAKQGLRDFEDFRLDY